MSETFFEKWKHRFSSAWSVLIGRAFAAYYYDDCLTKYGDHVTDAAPPTTPAE